MAKFVLQAVQDAQLDQIAQCTEMYFCNGQPSDRADAIARARHAAAITLASGDFAKSSSGGDRVLTVAAKSVTANSSGNCDHIALCTGSQLRYVTTAPAQQANSGATISSGAFTITASALV